MFKNKAALSLSIRDIFYSQKMKATVKYGNVDTDIQAVSDSRLIALGFSYLFSKGKTGSQRKRTGGSAAEEQDRIGIGQ
jgi:hypothetical protein